MKKNFFKHMAAIVLCITLNSTGTFIVKADNSYINMSNIIDYDAWENMPQKILLKSGEVLDLKDFNEEANKVIEIDSGASVKIIGDPEIIFENLNIYCGSNVKLLITDLRFYSKRDIYVGDDEGKSALHFTEGINELILEGTNEISNQMATKPIEGFGAAVGVGESVELKIFSVDSSMKNELKAVGFNGAAGIGGGYNKSCGTIHIDSSVIYAEGDGSGIGGGYGAENGGNGGNVTTHKSKITAIGKGGAGIGGGAAMADGSKVGSSKIYGGDSGILAFHDSEIIAVGEKGAGIGGGMANGLNNQDFSCYGGGVDSITILNSEVDARSKNGAGIGGGRGLAQGKSENYAFGGGVSAGSGKAGTITINNIMQKVLAIGNGGAGIGGGSGDSVGDKSYSTGGETKVITITQGEVYAEGNDGAGIGGGNAIADGKTNSQAKAGNGGTIQIAGGVIEAKSQKIGAGIGGGGGKSIGVSETYATGGNAGIVKITGGLIKANSDGVVESGTGIGGGVASLVNDKQTKYASGTGGSGGEISISNATVTAKTFFSSGSAGIGGGGLLGRVTDDKGSGGNGGNIAIYGDAFVQAIGSKTARNIGGGAMESGSKVNDGFTQIFTATASKNSMGTVTATFPKTDKNYQLNTSNITCKINGTVKPNGTYSVKNPFVKSNLESDFVLNKPDNSSIFYVAYYGILPSEFAFQTEGYPAVKLDVSTGKTAEANFVAVQASKK